MATTPPNAGRDWTKWFWLCATLLIAGFLVLAFLGVYQQDATYDEPVYFGVGKNLIEKGAWNVRGAALHPPLSFYVNSLPLLLIDRTPSNHAQLLLICRLTSLAVFAPPLLVAILLWARELYGRAAGLVALALAAFSPTLLAHAPLLTPDLALTTTGFIAMYLFWRSGSGARAALPWGILLGLALLSKVSSVLLVGAVALSALVVAWRRRDPGRLFGLLSGLAAALLVLNLGYGFHGISSWDQKAALMARFPVPLPAGVSPVVSALLPLPYLRVVVTQLGVGVKGWPSFLLGEVSPTGWWYYYFVAFLIKETLPFLVLLAASVFCARRTRASRLDELLLLIPPVLFLGFFSFVGKVHIGIRYLLPAFPFLFVSAAKVIRLRQRARWPPVVVCGLLVWHAVSALRICPDYLAYFNELVGGPRNGYLYLGDSNLDWGQNRTRIKAYTRKHRIRLEPKLLPETGRVAVRADRLQGRANRRLYRLLREEYAPEDQLGYNWLIYDLERGRRFPADSILPVLSGPTWLATPGREPGWQAPGFVPIGWKPAFAAPGDEFQAAAEYPGTQAVLMSCTAPLSECHFLRSFPLGRPAVQAILHFASRDRYEIYANGRLVAGRSQCAAAFVEEEHRLTRHLQPGGNSIAIWEAACESAPHGVFVELRVAQASP